VQGAAATLLDNATRSPKRAKDFILLSFFLVERISGISGEILSFSKSLVMILYGRDDRDVIASEDTKCGLFSRIFRSREQALSPQ